MFVCVCVWVSVYECWYLWSPEEGARAPGAGVRGTGTGNWKQSQVLIGWYIITLLRWKLFCCVEICFPLWLLQLYLGYTIVTDKGMKHWWLLWERLTCLIVTLGSADGKYIRDKKILFLSHMPPTKQFRVWRSTSHAFRRIQIKPSLCTNNFRVIVEISVERWLSIETRKHSQTCVAIVTQYTGQGLRSVGDCS